MVLPPVPDKRRRADLFVLCLISLHIVIFSAFTIARYVYPLVRYFHALHRADCSRRDGCRDLRIGRMLCSSLTATAGA
jgi:hypothetical protein